MTTPLTDKALMRLLTASSEAARKLPSAERAALLAQQARSFARAEAGFGSDRDEAEYRRAIDNNDTETLARLDEEAAARVDAVKDALDGREPRDKMEEK